MRKTCVLDEFYRQTRNDAKIAVPISTLKYLLFNLKLSLNFISHYQDIDIRAVLCFQAVLSFIPTFECSIILNYHKNNG